MRSWGHHAGCLPRPVFSHKKCGCPEHEPDEQPGKIDEDESIHTWTGMASDTPQRCGLYRLARLAVLFVVLGCKKKAKHHNTDRDVDNKESVHSFIVPALTIGTR